ncbi:MAG: hypothetical protein H6600_02645 [Flavobacteriales bacterium]|nr:hypothetical protein [Flavobacteriales bacterium]
MNKLSLRTTMLLAIASGMILISCNKLPHVDATRNDPNDLRISHTNLNGESETYTYDYNCSSDTNQLRIAGPLSQGIIKVSIFNASDSLFYNKSFTSISAVDQLMISPAGKWSVQVEFMNSSGTFSLRLNPESAE